MRDQGRFPVGFGCDPTLASGGGGSERRANAPRPPLPPGPPARRLVRPAPPAAPEAPRGLSTLWTSAILGLVLASSLYFLNYL